MQSYNVFYKGLQVEDISSDSIICTFLDTDIRYSDSDASLESQKKAEEYFSSKHGYDINDVKFIEKIIDRTNARCKALFTINVRNASDNDIVHISDCLDRARIIHQEIQVLDNKIEDLSNELEKFLTLKEALESHRIEVG